MFKPEDYTISLSGVPSDSDIASIEPENHLKDMQTNEGIKLALKVMIPLITYGGLLNPKVDEITDIGQLIHSQAQIMYSALERIIELEEKEFRLEELEH